MVEAPFKLLFMGTPEFAVPALRRLAADARFNVAAAVTQPDKPAGRGQKLHASPVKHAAQALSIPVLQPAGLKNLQQSASGILSGEGPSSDFAQSVNALGPFDAIIVIAYGKIIPDALLNVAPSGIVNVHPSLLPRWRGAAPIQQALFAGDTESGVALMRLDSGLDTGPVFCTVKTEIKPDDSFGSLHNRLAELGSSLLAEKLPLIISGALRPTPQSDEGATYAEKWDKQDLTINWKEPAERTLRRIRASSPEPGARTQYKAQLLKIFAAASAGETDAAPGTIAGLSDEGVLVACGDGRLVSLLQVQFPGKTRISAAEALRGRAFRQGESFERSETAG